MSTNTDKTCKTCRFGAFDADEQGGRKWQGRCLAKVMHMSDEEIKTKDLKAQTVMQHFKCSNNFYEAM